MKRALLIFTVALICVPRLTSSGVFIGAAAGDLFRVVHPSGYMGVGGDLEVRVCIDPDVANAPNVTNIHQVVIPVLNTIETWNERQASIPNLFFGNDNNIPNNVADLESTLVHEAGHCLGLGHPNAASESGLPDADEEYTKTTLGANGVYDLNRGSDGVRGSSDDQRGDDENLHWFFDGINNPYYLTGTVDRSNYTRLLSDLPNSHNFAANAARDVGNLLGYANSEAVMQQGAFFDEDQRRLSPDDVAMMRYASTGLDETAGTADDYNLILKYAGVQDSCDIRIRYTGTSFASCSWGTTSIQGDHYRLTTSNINISETTDWFYNNVVRVPRPTIVVSKTPSRDSVPETGGVVHFTVRVENTPVQPARLHTLEDDLYGDLDGQGTCTLPQTIPSLGSYECTFSATLSGPGGTSETSTTEAEVVGTVIPLSASNSDSSTVTFTDALPSIGVLIAVSPQSVPETGQNVTFTVSVENQRSESVDITSIEDSVFGDLNGQGNCGRPTITGNSTYQCSYSRFISGDAGGNVTTTTTATVRDNEGNVASDSDSVAVSITNVAPSITVTKTVSPETVPEPGALVTYSVRIDNISQERARLTSLVDELFGELVGEGTCENLWINAGSSYTCSFGSVVSGNAGDVEVSTVTATVRDNEGSMDSANDSAAVTVTDVMPSVRLTNTGSMTSVSEPGQEVTFEVLVTNQSVERITITGLEHEAYGTLNGLGNCSFPRILLVDRFYSCQFSIEVGGNAGDRLRNRVTVTVEDDEGNQRTAAGTHFVDVLDLTPALTVSQQATPLALPEPGGEVTFTMQVINGTAETVDLTELSHADLGSLNGVGDCVVPQTLLGNGTYECSYVRSVSGGGGSFVNNSVSATVGDDEGGSSIGSSTIQISIEDVLPSLTMTRVMSPSSLPEPGGQVTSTVQIENLSAEEATMIAVADDLLGDLDGIGTCALPQTIAANSIYECSFPTAVDGDAGDHSSYRATASVTDDEGNQANAEASAVVSITNVDPMISVTRSSSAESVPEPGGELTFTTVVHNASPEVVTLSTLQDDQYGDLDGQGTCSLPQAIPAGGAYPCSFPGPVAGNAGSKLLGTISAVAADNEDQEDSANGSSLVTVTDVLPTLTASVIVSPDMVEEPGAEVEFSIQLTNTSVESVHLVALTDSVFGDLNGAGSCSVPQTLAVGASYSCAHTALVTGAPDSEATFEIHGTAHDDETNSTTATASAVVEVVAGEDEVDLRIEASSAPAPVVSGSTLGYSITTSNQGPDIAEDVVVTATLPPQVTVLSTSGCTEGDDGEWTCSVGQLDALDQHQIAINVEVDAAFEGLLEASFAVRSSTLETHPGDESTSVVVEAVFASHLIFVDGFESGNTQSWQTR